MMKRLVPLFLVLLPITVQARLGDTREQADERYGLPKRVSQPGASAALLEAAREYTYHFEGYSIRCAALPAKDGREYIVREEYCKIFNAETMKAGAVLAIRDFEAEAILQSEAGGHTWKKPVLGRLSTDPVQAVNNQFAYLSGLSGQVWERDDHAVANLGFGQFPLRVELPQARAWEEQIKALKDQRARAAAARLIDSTTPASSVPPTIVVSQPSPVAQPSAVKITPAPAASLPPPARATPPPAGLPRTSFNTSTSWMLFGSLGLVLTLKNLLPRKRSSGRKSQPPAPPTLPPPTPVTPQAPALREKATISPVPSSLEDLSWDEFELLVGELYRRQGYMVQLCRAAGADGGIDLRLRRGEEHILVQCKKWASSKVTAKEIREFYGVLVSERASRGIFVATCAYTRDAQAFAAGKPLELINGAQLATLLASARRSSAENLLDLPSWLPGFIQSAELIDPACPFCQGRMVVRQSARGPFWGCTTYPRCRGSRKTRSHLPLRQPA